jgi:hypothetical protein
MWLLRPQQTRPIRKSLFISCKKLRSRDSFRCVCHGSHRYFTGALVAPSEHRMFLRGLCLSDLDTGQGPQKRPPEYPNTRFRAHISRFQRACALLQLTCEELLNGA